jgi:acyl-CoA thioesterase-1
MILIIFFAILGLLNIQDEEKTIIFYGDSLTAGYGLDSENAFPALIKNRLNKEGMNYRVVAAGVSGETSSGGLTRINWVLNQPVDIFVLELGANDGLRGIPPEETHKNLQGIIDKVHEKNPKCSIILAGMMVPPNMGQDYSKKFATIFPSLSEANDSDLIPFLLEGVAGDPDLNLPDGIHPNVEGHKIVAGNIMKVLGPLL